jgi:monoamine oxidase
MERRRVEVVVVGAGLSGLAAARRLHSRGRSVCVLEAQASVGGRIERLEGPGDTAIDGGGQFLGETQTRIFELADELELAPSPLSKEGRFVNILAGVRSTSDEGLLGEAGARRRYNDALRQILDLTSELSLVRPWTHPRAAEWDSQVFRTWTEANIPERDVRDAVEATLMPAGSAADVSLFHVLVYVRGIGDEKGLRTTEYALIPGGTFQIPERMAAELGEAVALESPVRAIAHGPTAVRVTSDRIEVDADTAIIALAPPLVERIEFTPDLPPRRRILQHRWVQQPSIKSIAVYETAWWRERGYSGEAVTDLPVAQFIMNASAPGGMGILVSFTNLTRRPPTWVIEDADRRHSQFLKTVTAAFGPDAPPPLAYLEGNWMARRWSYGCGQMLQCGVLSRFGDVLRAPVGRLIWAGTEVAIGWATYMEGAIRAGEQAAEQALAL